MKFYIEQLANIIEYEQAFRIAVYHEDGVNLKLKDLMLIKFSKGNEALELDRPTVEYLKAMCEKYLEHDA